MLRQAFTFEGGEEVLGHRVDVPVCQKFAVDLRCSVQNRSCRSMILPQRREQLAGDVPVEAPDNVLLGEALLGASDDVLNCGFVPLHANQDDPIEQGIGLSEPAA